MLITDLIIITLAIQLQYRKVYLMQEKRAEISTNNLNETFIFDKVAKHANGSVMYRQGKAVIIATVTLDETPVDEPFLPLTVQYIEKAYAAAKIPGGFIKRESKPSDFETLTSRLIDRSLRPLFPDGFIYPVVITAMVVSSDLEVDLQLAALHASMAALLVSDLPIKKSLAGIRIGKIEGEYIINPTSSQIQNSTLDLFVSGSDSDTVMIEMATKASEKVDNIELDEMELDMMVSPTPMVLEHQEANEMPEDELVDIIAMASKAIKEASNRYQEAILPLKKDIIDLEFIDTSVDKWLLSYVKEYFHTELSNVLEPLSKSERGSKLKDIIKNVEKSLEENGTEYEKDEVKKAVEAYKKELVRKQIINERVRADGRRLNEVRPINIETNILPSVHGSCLFTRGETQVLATVTLGGAKDGQMYELLGDKSPRNERFMVHYNFPGFSVGEAKPIMAPGRRELGHGTLAKRALEPVIEEKSDRTIRLVAETLESNGSSSMATICAGSLALYSAEVESIDLVAGVAMGLVIEDDKYAILTDIMGLEDHDGDMDFKVAGTHKGITAMQMDIKVSGLNLDILKEALYQAKEAREHILSIMEKAKENIKPSGALPTVEHFSIDPMNIVHIIGKAGATIRDIIDRFEVAIDLNRDDGSVKIVGHDKEKVIAAKEHIHKIASSNGKISYDVGKVYKGKVKKIMDYGMFVEMPGGIDALLHISKVSKQRTQNLRDLYKEGDKIDVVVLEQKGHKIELATKEYLD